MENYKAKSYLYAGEEKYEINIKNYNGIFYKNCTRSISLPLHEIKLRILTRFNSHYVAE